MKIVALIWALSFVTFQASAGSNAQLNPKCKEILADLSKHGVTDEALYAFQQHASAQGVLERVEGQKKIALADLTKPASDARFFVLDLATGKLEHQFETARSKGNHLGAGGAVISFEPFRPGRDMAPAGLMRIDSQYTGQKSGDTGQRSRGNALIGLEKENAMVKRGSGVNIQTCPMKAGVANHISKGSFCLEDNSYDQIGAELRGSYLYSIDPKDHDKKLSAEERAGLCSLFGLRGNSAAPASSHSGQGWD